MENSKVSAGQHPAKKRLKNPLVWGLLILAGLLVFGYTQLGWFGGSKAITPEYLISISASDGAIVGQEDEDGCFELTLRGADNVVWFTDRPEREALSTHVTSLVNGWSEEFGSNPPNADLQLFRDNGSDLTVILTLRSTPVWDEDAQTLNFNKACPFQIVDNDRFDNEDPTIEVVPASIAGNTFSAAVLFIDGAKLFAWNSCYTGSNAPDDRIFCIEQWGSYHASCGNIDDHKSAPGKRCKDVCNRSNGSCPNGCYNSYDSNASWFVYGSTYGCSN